MFFRKKQYCYRKQSKVVRKRPLFSKHYFGEEKEERSGMTLVSGILSTLFGLSVVFGSGVAAVTTIMPFILAVWVLVSGITRIDNSISLKSEGVPFRGWLLTFGIIGTVFGFLLLFSPILSAWIISVSL